MDASQIIAGRVYEDWDGFSHYVVATTPAQGRRLPRVTWRRPGAFARALVTETMPKFLARKIKLSKDQSVAFAELLPNGGMAARQSAANTEEISNG